MTPHHDRRDRRIRRLRIVALAATGVMLAAACSSGSKPPPATPGGNASGGVSSTASASPPHGAVTVLPASLIKFGSYRVVPLTDPDRPAYSGPATPTSMTGVQVAGVLKETLAKPGVTETLTDQGFVVVPEDQRYLHYAYDESFYNGWPVYVTTDAAYHVWHLTFDAILRTTEQQKLLPALRSLIQQSVTAAHQQTTQLAGTPLADAAARAEQLYQVAAAELGLPVSLGPLAKQEKALVDAHAGVALSPILGTRIDYSLLTPRGHYTRGDALKRYFVAMSVLGQGAFCLPGTLDCDATNPQRPSRVGLLATRVLLGTPQRKALWQAVYEPSAFLVGLSDDYTPGELDAAARAAAANWPADPTVIADDATVTAIVERLRTTRPVRIDPERASVRLMGTRFTIDSFIMDQLVAPNVGENAAGARRELPSALDVAAALGSAKARKVLSSTGAMDYQRYREQLDRLSSRILERPPADWGGTVYDAWLHALEPALLPHGAAYPPMMRTDAWAAKGLVSGLGSYAQLKHDTILYTKQSVAEGGGDEPKVPPRNWVEPEPVAFGRLAAAIDLLRTGLDQRKLLTGEQAKLAADVSELFTFFARIASDELAGKPLAKADNDRLNFIGGTFEQIWFRTSEADYVGDDDSAVIADIASGPGQVLNIGIGRFDKILVLVPQTSGTFAVAAGAVFSYYEFATGAGERLTDATWRSRLDEGKAPARPDWQKVLFPRGELPRPSPLG
jgi:hypothetical protein